VSVRFDLFDLVPDFLADAAQCIRRLQVHPEFSRCAKKKRLKDCHVRAYTALFGCYIADSLGGHSKGFGQRIAGNPQGLQKFMF
jgi:hypothetical protein